MTSRGLPQEQLIKLFFVSNQLAENDLGRIEKVHGLDLGRRLVTMADKDEDYYPQIEQEIRREAAAMGDHYEVFYSLENSIRSLISNTLEAAEPSGWWGSARVNTVFRKDVENRIQREIDSGVTPRSREPIDFTTFGELGEIIKTNWDLFGSIFNSKKAVERVMANLNTLRGPIAHCSPLAEDEVVRLRLSVKDWFRLME